MKSRLLHTRLKTIANPIFIFMLLFISTSNIQAAHNNDSQNIYSYQSYTASYILILQENKNNYISGYSIQTSCGFFLKNNFALGVGAGIMAIEEERFMPFYGELIKIVRLKNKSAVLKMQMGYSLGWNTAFPEHINYSYSGGPYFDLGIGKKVYFSNNYVLFVKISYRNQFASIDCNANTYGIYPKNISFNMLVLTLGLNYHNR